jgi:hypothetical protein
MIQKERDALPSALRTREIAAAEEGRMRRRAEREGNDEVGAVSAEAAFGRQRAKRKSRESQRVYAMGIAITSASFHPIARIFYFYGLIKLLEGLKMTTYAMVH